MKYLFRSGILTVSYILCIALAPISTQGNSRTLYIFYSDWWVNLPDAPIQIVLCPSKKCFSLGNKSAKAVIGYKLGCVSLKNRKWKVVSIRRTLNASLEPYDASTSTTSSIFFRMEDIEKDKCQGIAAKLAVVEVTFADKSSWEIR